MPLVEKNYLAIDPGYNTGVAVWQFTEWADLLAPYRTFTITAPRKGTWQERMISLANRLQAVFDEFQPIGLAMEVPQFFNDAGGEMAAAGGALVKLTLSAGVVIGLANRTVRYWHLPTVHNWKGQLPKEVVHRRLSKRWCEFIREGLSGHEKDAAALGLWTAQKYGEAHK